MYDHSAHLRELLGLGDTGVDDRVNDDLTICIVQSKIDVVSMRHNNALIFITLCELVSTE